MLKPNYSGLFRFILIIAALLLAALITLGNSNAKQRTTIQEQEGKTTKLQKELKQLQQEKEQLNKEVSQSKRQQVQRTRQQVYSTGSCEQYRGIVSKYDWPVDTVLRIMKAESGCNPKAVSSTNDRGLMQINWVHSDKVGGDLTKLFDPQINLAVAYQIYSTSGWTPWSVCRYNIKCY